MTSRPARHIALRERRDLAILRGDRRASPFTRMTCPECGQYRGSAVHRAHSRKGK